MTLAAFDWLAFAIGFCAAVVVVGMIVGWFRNLED